MRCSVFHVRRHSIRICKQLCCCHRFLRFSHRCSTVEALDFPEEISNSEFCDRKPDQNPIFCSPSPNGKPRLSFHDQSFEESCTSRRGELWESARMCLRRKMQECAREGYLVEALDALRLMEPSVLDCNALLHCYLKSGRVCVDELRKVFEGMKRIGPYPNVWTFNTLFNGMCTLGRLKDARFIVEEMCSYGFVPSFASLKRLIRKSLSSALVLGFSMEGLWKEAYRVLEHMRDDGYMPTVVVYTILIKFLCKDRKIKDAISIFETMEKEGCHPDLVTCNILLHALCCHNKFQEAHELVQFMEQKGYLPDQFTHCALASGLLKSGYVRNSQDYLLNILYRRNDVDTVTWNIYIHSLCCDSRAQEALNLVSSMLDKGFVPTTVTYNTILKGLCREENIDEALEVLDHFDWSGNGPDLISFNTILSAAGKQGNSSMIRRILYRMDVEGIKLNVVSMTCLMHYFCKVRRFVECFKLFEHMICDGHRPTATTLNVLLDSLCKKGLLADAYRIFSEFKNIGTFPDTASYNILIHASIRKADYVSVKCLLTDMYSRGLVPDAITYGSLSYGLCKEGNVNVALHLEDWMIESGVSPSISYYNTLMDAAFRMGRLWDVFLILIKMQLEGIEPDAISFKILSRAMAKGGTKQFPKAMKFLEFLMNRGEKPLDLEVG
uniref:Pentatricopeptide repeat-containing protein At1g62720 isoform X2 n=1 Tax=Elaeis guineensis var. tenera TaxID=51953 RepID=A0A6I9QCJ5_ELAGV|nr:pentatricopeptide repeat-containing protein At1g62720 isoform X2 [Elaeis guineensis]